jgi:hypothetical protein
MPERTFTLLHDIQLFGKPHKAGDRVILNTDDPNDFHTLGTLLASGRIAETEAAAIPYTPPLPPTPTPEAIPRSTKKRATE